MKNWEIGNSNWKPKYKVLYHVHSNGHRCICNKRTNRPTGEKEWICPQCKTPVPEEMQFVAELADCLSFTDNCIRRIMEATDV